MLERVWQIPKAFPGPAEGVNSVFLTGRAHERRWERMARPIRVEFEGAVYHVTARGNERKRIYRELPRNLGRSSQNARAPPPCVLPHAQSLSSVVGDAPGQFEPGDRLAADDLFHPL